MSESGSKPAGKAPWHLWVTGVAGLLWNSMGALDYVMTATRNVSYMSSFTPEQLAFFYSLPAWTLVTWALGVWGGVAGAILLLLRKGIAVWVFLVSLLGMLLTTLHNYFLSNAMEVIGDPFSLLFTLFIFLIALGLFLYSRAMLARKVIV